MKELPGQLLLNEDCIDDVIKGTTERSLARMLLCRGLEVRIQPDISNKKKADFFVINRKNPHAKGTLIEVTDSNAQTAKRNKFAKQNGSGQTNALIQYAAKRGYKWSVLTRENLYHMSKYANIRFSKYTSKNPGYDDVDLKNYPYLYQNLGLHLGLTANEASGLTYKPRGTYIQKTLVLELLKMWVYKREKVTEGQGLPVDGIALAFQCHPNTILNNVNGYPSSPNTGMGCFEVRNAYSGDDLVPIISAKPGNPIEYCSNCYFHERNLCNPTEVLPPMQR